jgi:Ni,Fe-hydrogenase III large subunit
VTAGGQPIRNGGSLPLSELPLLGLAEFQERTSASLAAGARMASFFGLPEDLVSGTSSDRLRLVALLARETDCSLQLLSTLVRDRYPSLTPRFPQLHRFEREVLEQWGVVPEDHPWPKPVRFQKPFGGPGKLEAAPATVGVTDFFRVGGSEVHEVAVGPVHAGVIEPGHFRFQCHGEDVLHLEISLGYQHRGVERALIGSPHARSRHYAETLAGDTSVGHATAYAQIVEALCETEAPEGGLALRSLALELERLANHVGDLGALAGDVAFLPTASYCGRLRGEFLNMTALVCGNRFGRGLVVPGGAAFECEEPRRLDILDRLGRAAADLEGALDLLWTTPSAMARFAGTGPLSRELSVEMGLVGLAARATGLARDVRRDFPAGDPLLAEIGTATAEGGDVLARAEVRRREIEASLAFVRDRLARWPEAEHRRPTKPVRAGRIAVALVEGWRGEICHVALTGPEGLVSHYKVVDPSFHNWAGLALALRDQQISDFPLCNKSFNLSYCGQDL